MEHCSKRTTWRAETIGELLPEKGALKPCLEPGKMTNTESWRQEVLSQGWGALGHTEGNAQKAFAGQEEK